MKLPSLFVSHGAPTLPFDDVPARDFLRMLGQRFAKPKAIVCASAHWDTAVPELNAVEANETIHDYYGFPDALYRLQYDAPGAPWLARDVEDLLSGAHAQIDDARGLDHGAWVPLMLMYPDADIPVIQVSVQSNREPEHHIALGRALAPLREENILVIGSGSFVHNLRALDRGGIDAPEPQWSADFSNWMNSALTEGREDDLANYRRLAPNAARAQCGARPSNGGTSDAAVRGLWRRRQSRTPPHQQHLRLAADGCVRVLLIADHPLDTRWV